MLFFDRRISLTIARPAPTSFFKTLPNAVVVEDLRVQFRIEKQLGKDPNTCEVIVSNLAQNTRAELQTKPLNITLEAGYDTQVARLFRGDLQWSESKRVGPDFESKLLIGDGDRAYRYARVNRTFKAGTSHLTILAEAADSMNVSIPNNVKADPGMQGQTATGVTLRGYSRNVISRIAKIVNREWSIQDGVLQMNLRNETNVGEAFVVSEDTGMIGTPEFGSPPKKKEQPVLKVRSLLRPEINAGTLISVEAANINGNFKVRRVTHSGDTHGVAWYSEMEAVPL